jgi:hypothetical protein
MFQESIFNVNVLINEPGKGRGLTMCFTQDEAGQRYCPFSMGNSKSFCEGSGCHGWRWLPNQHDARTAKGFCGMAA